MFIGHPNVVQYYCKKKKKVIDKNEQMFYSLFRTLVLARGAFIYGKR